MFEMVLGHLVGDYLLQNNWMALGKSKHNGLGWLSCFIHCYLYTLAVCTVMVDWRLSWVVTVFLSHFVIDKFGVPELYLRLINGRSLTHFMRESENSVYSPHIGLRAGFYVLVYTVVDNTMHLLLMFYMWKFLR